MAFNEAESLECVTREIHAVLLELEQPFEVLIIDDGSSDGTDIIARRLSKQFPEIRVVHHDTNRGLGGVYRTGFSQARAELITFFPADGQFPATIIKQFVPLMNNADMVLGYISNRNPSLVSSALSKIRNIVYEMLLGPMPKLQAIFMMRRLLLDEIQLKSTGRGWAIVMELIIRASRSGYRIVNSPTEVQPRMRGKSKVHNLRSIWANLTQVIALRRHI